jgi:hypothetical protein
MQGFGKRELSPAQTVASHPILSHVRFMKEAKEISASVGAETLDIADDSPDVDRLRDLFASIKGSR